MFSVTVTIDDQICYVLCDTTMITVLPFPTITLNVMDDNCENRELTYVVGSDTDTQGGVIIVNEQMDTIMSNTITVSTVDDVGSTFFARITDSCGNEADTIFTVPDFTPNPDLEFNVSSMNLCEFGQLLLGVNWPGGNQPLQSFLWSTNETTPQIAIESPGGTFSVTVTDACGYETTGSFTLDPEDFEIPSPTVDINVPDVNCDLGFPSITLTAEIGNIFTGIQPQILWSDQSTTESITVTEPGTFSVTVTVCDSTATASVEITDMLMVDLPTIEIEADNLSPVTCDIALTATTFMAEGITSSIIWSTNELGPTITINQAGIFTATVTDMCGQSAETSITITEENLDFDDPTVTITTSLTDECEELLQADASSPAGVEIVGFLWSDGSQTNSIVVNNGQEFFVTVTDNCGNTGVASIQTGNVSTELEFPNLFFPNSVPTDDFLDNNTFGPFTVCPQLITDYNLQIFNRWGRRVFETDFVDQRWSGSLDNAGERLEEGVYKWTSTYFNAGVEEFAHGHVTLVRN